MSGSPLLQVTDLEMRFGGIVALAGVSFDVGARDICGLIGPNGSGKTTMFNCISGIYRATRGQILFAGTRIDGAPRHRMMELGIGRTFQNVALFRSMTVRQNILVGAHTAGKTGFLENFLISGRARREDQAANARVDDLLDLLDLRRVGDTNVAGLPFGWQKRVELARALISRPKLLLLDEPAAGLNHEEVEQLGDLVVRLRDTFDMAILLVEHHMGLVMRLSDKVVALEFGRKIADASPQDVQRSPEVIRAYLGEGLDAN